jgi:o-succinylbenzoate---CoA ligase
LAQDQFSTLQLIKKENISLTKRDFYKKYVNHYLKKANPNGCALRGSHDMESRVLPNWLKQRTRLTPERIAVQTEETELSWLELEARVAKLAQVLYKKGVTKGTRVALLQANTLDLILTLHALMYLEAVTVPLNIRLTPNELTWQIKDCQASMLVYDERHASLIASLNTDLGLERLISIKSLMEETQIASQYSACDEFDLDALHTIIYTSGTTGHPKGVQLTLGNHWWSAVGSMLNLGLSATDHWLCVVPLFHVSGLSILLKSVIYGMKMTLIEKFSASTVNHYIQTKGVTHISVVTTMLQALVEDSGWGKYPETFRCMLLGGGPVPLSLLNVCKDKEIPVFQTYGLSETASQIVTLAPEYMLSKLGSAGRPLFPAQIKIMKDGEVLGPDQEGEILVKGPNVTSGYDHLQDASREAIKDGWLHTGDMGRLDEDGFLYVLDRRKDMIVSGGENIYPAEIESVLSAHPDVLEAGVIGRPDAQWGKVPVAFVVLRNGIEFEPNILLAHCREHLARYKVPREIFRVEQLPRNASRKLLRRELAALLPTDLDED